MSRIGNSPITVPEGVEVKLDGQKITVKGPKGTLEKELHKNMEVTVDGNVIEVIFVIDLNAYDPIVFTVSGILIFSTNCNDIDNRFCP